MKYIKENLTAIMLILIIAVNIALFFIPVEYSIHLWLRVSTGISLILFAIKRW